MSGINFVEGSCCTACGVDLDESGGVHASDCGNAEPVSPLLHDRPDEVRGLR